MKVAFGSKENISMKINEQMRPLKFPFRELIALYSDCFEYFFEQPHYLIEVSRLIEVESHIQV